jgi:hypothetical protein
MRRAGLSLLVFFLFTVVALAGDGDPKSAVVGVWTMGFCKAQSPLPYPLAFDCTTQVVNFHEDGSVWSSYMFDQFPSSTFGGLSVGAVGKWHYLGDRKFYVTMLRFVNDRTTGFVLYLLRTDFTVEAHHMADEAITGKMAFLIYLAEPAAPLKFPVVKKDPYKDTWDQMLSGPTGIPMKRVPSFDPDSPVLP